MESTNFTGKLLIAMPVMGDNRFARSVVYVCAHSKEGTMGLIVNKPSPDIRFFNLLEQLGIETGQSLRKIRVHVGGPVELSRGFILHTTDYKSEGGTLEVDDHISMTATMDVIEEIAQGGAPASLKGKSPKMVGSLVMQMTTSFLVVQMSINGPLP